MLETRQNRKSEPELPEPGIESNRASEGGFAMCPQRLAREVKSRLWDTRGQKRFQSKL